ncbi:MAG: hypothetical protein LBI65_04470 [Candidatus Symbiothrix sp.]|jgi:hypothetical protein|nr:hypothetical protein [Candidatus Symbiothrix sp.]
MKKTIKFTVLAFAAVFALAACAPQEFDEYSLGGSYTITQDQFTFDMTPGSDEFTYNFTTSFSVDPVKYPYSFEIHFGEGVIVKEATGSHEYIVPAGTYIAQCRVSVPNGEVLVKEKSIIIVRDNEKFYQDDPASVQYALTGGKDNDNGKVWTLTGGSGLGPGTGTWGEWWDFGGTPELFDDEFTFLPDNVQPHGKFSYNSNGATFMNESLAGSFPDGDPEGSFVTTSYTPPADASWNIESKDGKRWLTINKGFIGYAVAPGDLVKTEYEILSFSPAEIRLKYYASDGNAWFFVLTSEIPSNPLTGEGSKTWVIDGYNKHLDEVAAAIGPNIKGFMGLGLLDSYGQEWWGAEAGNKSFETVGWTLYDWKITFTSANQLSITTQGEGYGRKVFDGETFTSTRIEGDDMIFAYDGGDYTYTLTDATPYPKLTLSGNAFLGYYAGTQEYEIIYLSDNALAVAAHNTREGQDWVLIFTPEGEQ